MGGLRQQPYFMTRIKPERQVHRGPQPFVFGIQHPESCGGESSYTQSDKIEQGDWCGECKKPERIGGLPIWKLVIC